MPTTVYPRTCLVLLCSIVLLYAATSDTAAALSDQVSAAPVRIWVVGDSLTRGAYATGEASTYRNVLFSRLQTRYPGRVRVLLWREFCTLVRMEQHWDDIADAPDLLFIEMGINDLGNPGCPQIPEAAWQVRYGAMLDYILARTPAVMIVVGTIPWCGWAMGTGERERALLYSQRIRAEAEARHLAVADLWAATVDRPDGLSSPDQASSFQPAYRGDGFHPSDLGHQRIAQAFYQAYLEHYGKEYRYLPLMQ